MSCPTGQAFNMTTCQCVPDPVPPPSNCTAVCSRCAASLCCALSPRQWRSVDLLRRLGFGCVQLWPHRAVRWHRFPMLSARLGVPVAQQSDRPPFGSGPRRVPECAELRLIQPQLLRGRAESGHQRPVADRKRRHIAVQPAGAPPSGHVHHQQLPVECMDCVPWRKSPRRSPHVPSPSAWTLFRLSMHASAAGR